MRFSPQNLHIVSFNFKKTTTKKTWNCFILTSFSAIEYYLFRLQFFFLIKDK